MTEEDIKKLQSTGGDHLAATEKNILGNDMTKIWDYVSSDRFGTKEKGGRLDFVLDNAGASCSRPESSTSTFPDVPRAQASSSTPTSSTPTGSSRAGSAARSASTARCVELLPLSPYPLSSYSPTTSSCVRGGEEDGRAGTECSNPVLTSQTPLSSQRFAWFVSDVTRKDFNWLLNSMIYGHRASRSLELSTPSDSRTDPFLRLALSPRSLPKRVRRGARLAQEARHALEGVRQGGQDHLRGAPVLGASSPPPARSKVSR